MLAPLPDDAGFLPKSNSEEGARPKLVGPERQQAGSSTEAEFALLYEREALLLTRTAYGIVGSRELAEECVQEAFARAYRQAPDGPDGISRRYLVQRIAINLALSKRRRDRLRLIKNRHSDSSRSRSEGVDLMAELGHLPAKQLTAILLRINHGYDDREIALTLGITARDAAVRVDGALTRLRRLQASAPSHG